jgi:maltose alpha-D-glucosyltransferase/alpha-amylase
VNAERLWYKDAIIYELHVRAFFDSNADGVGDFRGLTEKLDYLQDLGVTALWLLPFFPSPLRDDGYDIADYTAVHPGYGTLADFRHFLREAHRRGLRVIIELVLNHTSDQHPWFQRARRAEPGSVWRNFYVWSDTPDRFRGVRIIFQDFEDSNWTWDPVARAYYWHRFFRHQPDLNYDNPAVRREIFRVLDFWLQMGVDGFRLDAVPYLYEREGTSCENLPETHAFLRELRRHMERRYPDRMLLAEVNQWPEDTAAYFGQGDEVHMAFHFPLMPRLFMALRMEDRAPLVDILQQTPPIPPGCQWALFLRNHDELTLEMLTDEERDFMYRVYARDPQARIHLGIRRRLAPLLNNDRRAIELMVGLLFSLPGTPVLYYGDEIGMGDNIYLGDRNAVRTPMQWSADRNAGFSNANPQRLYLPVVIDPPFHYEAVNVEAQRGNPHSLLQWMKRTIAIRKSHPVFGRGDLQFIESDNRRVVAFTRSWQDQTLLVVANLSENAQFAELDLSPYRSRQPVELFGGVRFPAVDARPYLLTLGPHAFYWFSLEPRTVDQIVVRPLAVAGATPEVEMAAEGESLLRPAHLQQLEPHLCRYLSAQPWCGGEARRLLRCQVEDAVPVHARGALLVIRAEFSDGEPELYLVTVAVSTGTEAERVAQQSPQTVLARLGSNGTATLLHSGLSDPAFCLSLLDGLTRRRRLRGQVGLALMRVERDLRDLSLAASELQAVRCSEQATHTEVIFGDRLVLRLYRRLEPGQRPEQEMARFFLQRTHFRNFPPLLGELLYRRGHGEPWTLGFCQRHVAYERTAWDLTVEAAERFYDRAAGEPLPAAETAEPFVLAPTLTLPARMLDRLGDLSEPVRRLAVRTAEMHIALGTCVDEVDFVPESFTLHYQRSLYQALRQLIAQVLDAVRGPSGQAVGNGGAQRRSAGAEAALLRPFRGLLERPLTAARTRIHGNYRLEQILCSGNDFIIKGFEGDPARPLSERKIKRSPLRDVGTLLWSFYQAGCAALERHGLGDGNDPLALGRMQQWWQAVVATFLQAYFDVVEGAPFLPVAREDLLLLIHLYLVERACADFLAECSATGRAPGSIAWSWLMPVLPGAGAAETLYARQR